LGVGLVLTLVIAPGVYKIWKSKTWAAVPLCFGLAFIVAWGVLDLVQRFFPSWTQSQRLLLVGEITGVPTGYQVQVASNLLHSRAAYIKRENDVDDIEYVNFPFLVLAPHSPTCLAVGIINNNPRDDGGTSIFKIPLMPDTDFKSETVLVAQPLPETVEDKKIFKLRVWRQVNETPVGQAKVLDPLDAAAVACPTGPGAALLNWLLPSAYAQSGDKVQNFSVRLKSDDVFVRRNARIELAKQGPQMIEMVRQFFNSGNYRLELGALVALSILPVAERNNLPPDVRAKVHEFTTNSDPTVRATASRIEAAN